MQFYKVKSHNLVFYAKVEHIPRDKRTIIQFGSAKFKDCLSIHIFGQSKIAELHGLIYNRLCAINMPLPKNEGTIRMVKAAMVFALQLSPHITKFELTDISQVDCGKHKIALADLYFITHGMTWYENRFGAQPSFTKYEYLKLIFQSKPKLDFDDLWEQYLKDGARLYKKSKEYYHNMYDQSSSWFYFLQKWFTEEGCRPFLYLADIPIGIIAVVNDEIQSLYGKVWEITKSTVFAEYDPIQVHTIPVKKFPNIEWRDTPSPKRSRGGRMILPFEVMNDRRHIA